MLSRVGTGMWLGVHCAATRSAALAGRAFTAEAGGTFWRFFRLSHVLAERVPRTDGPDAISRERATSPNYKLSAFGNRRRPAPALGGAPRRVFSV